MIMQMDIFPLVSSRWVRFRHLSSRSFRNRSEKSDYSFKSSNENKPLAICGFEP